MRRLLLLGLWALVLSPAAAAHGDDTDDDGWPNDVDCAPEDPLVYPGAGEICDDGIDDDCDEAVDEECGGCGGGDKGMVLAPLLLLGLRRRT